MILETSPAPLPFEVYEVLFNLPYAIWIPDDTYSIRTNERIYSIRTETQLRRQEEWLGSSIQFPGLVPLNDHQGLAGLTSLTIRFGPEGKQSIDEIIQLAIEGASRLVQVYRWIADSYYVRPITRADIANAKILYLDRDGEPINSGTVVGPPGPYGSPSAPSWHQYPDRTTY
jgi:hypothetical protein